MITNLKESYDMFKSEELQERYKLLRQPSIAKIHSIASHDYEALNWAIVKSGCKEIIEAYNSEIYHNESLKQLNNIPASVSETEGILWTSI